MRPRGKHVVAEQLLGLGTPGGPSQVQPVDIELVCSDEDPFTFDESLRQQLFILASAAQQHDVLISADQCAVPGATLGQDHGSQQLTTCEHCGRSRMTPLARGAAATLECVFEDVPSKATPMLQHTASLSHQIRTSSAAPLATPPTSKCVQSLIDPAKAAPDLAMQAGALALASLPGTRSSQLTTAARAPSPPASTFAANCIDLTPSQPWHAPSRHSQPVGPVHATPPCAIAFHRALGGLAASAPNAPMRPHVRGPVQSAALSQAGPALGSIYSNGCPNTPLNSVRTTASSQGTLLVQHRRSNSTGSLPAAPPSSMRTTGGSYTASAQPSEPHSWPGAPPPSECSFRGCEDVAAFGSMTLWDMLCGRFQSRIPGMEAFNERVRPLRWAAWDPCSKNRSR